MNPFRFWGSALLAAVLTALLVAFLFPFGAVGADDAETRTRAWLLTVWTLGVMAICFGGSGLLGALSPLGFRDVTDAGSVKAAIEARRDQRRQAGSAFYNFAGWTVGTGLFLLLVYFAGWILTRS